ncbi:MAG: hypothetical protein WBM57_10175, partial [Woeseiaceae bacterium]
VQILLMKINGSDRLVWVSGGNYSAKKVTGGFRPHTGLSQLCLANFANRPLAVGRRQSIEPHSSRL